MQRVGFVGLGRMGRPMASNLARKGFPLAAYDINPAGFTIHSGVYKARPDGQDNPNHAMIQALSKAGVDFRVCGQATLGRKIEPKDMMPEVQRDLWALTTIIALQQQGYVLIAP